MKEIWRDIEVYEGLYQVSNLGRVKSLNRLVKHNIHGVYSIKERILKTRKDKNGYYNVNLCKECKIKKYLVHRLVAQAFIDNPNNLPQVNHIDEIKSNNYVENLEWCDNQYNNAYSKNKSILCYTIENEFIKEFPSSTEASIELFGNIKFRINISQNLKKRNKTCKGYIFKYK